MKDNRNILKAFIHSLITLGLLCVLLYTNDIFNLMEYDDACRIKDYFKERIELYGDI